MKKGFFTLIASLAMLICLAMPAPVSASFGDKDVGAYHADAVPDMAAECNMSLQTTTPAMVITPCSVMLEECDYLIMDTKARPSQAKGVVCITEETETHASPKHIRPHCL